jgi:alpha-glucosidase
MESMAATQGAHGDWWRTAVLYHVYPRSFQDTDRDGVGDITGIIQRLDYLAGAPGSLGIDAIWLSPVFPSPMADFGYDVAVYTDVDPLFGTLADLDRLIAACHQRGIRLILDFVVNHTSGQHAWFIDSRASTHSPKRDWYLWRDPSPGGGPPNNWESAFGGSGWTFEETTGQYYFHSFMPQQPDLNWRNPDVVAAMQDVARFWLTRGVDGFRLDAVGRLLKDPNYSDNPAAARETANGNRTIPANNHLHADLLHALSAIRSVVDEFPGRVSIGEVYAPPKALARVYGMDGEGLHLAFNFGLIRAFDAGPYLPWTAESIAAALQESEEHLPAGAQACFQVSNLDVSRFVSRHDHDGLGYLRARAAALLLLGLRGTPCLYYGDELGMPDVPVPPEGRQDPVGRDPARTPMPWDASSGRGFTTGEPWLPFGPPSPNVEEQRNDPASILSLYRHAIAIRQREPALHSGAFTVFHSTAGTLLFERTAPGSRSVAVALNTSTQAQALPVPPGYSTVLLATDTNCVLAPGASSRSLVLRPLAAAWLAIL